MSCDMKELNVFPQFPSCLCLLKDGEEQLKVFVVYLGMILKVVFVGEDSLSHKNSTELLVVGDVFEFSHVNCQHLLQYRSIRVCLPHQLFVYLVKFVVAK